MNIGEVASLCNLPAKTIRFYEEIGLVRPDRRENGYRDFSEQDIYKLRFLQRARSLGFSVDECRVLLSLYEDEHRKSADVRSIALDHLQRIDQKLAELQSLRRTLSDLVEACHGDHRPDCPILEDLAGGAADR